jgi:transposase
MSRKLIEQIACVGRFSDEGGTPMRTGRPIPPVVLTDDERAALQRWVRRPTTARALAERARMVLECAAGKTNTSVAREMRLTKQTIGKWRSRFVRQRLEGLLDEPRPGAPRRISDGDVERVMRVTLETAPRDATHWSTRSMARRCGLSQTAVSRIWRAFSLRPHRVKTVKLSKDPLFIEKVRDIVGLYLNPPDKALVLCVDEKAQIQALDRTQPLLPMRPGQVERRTPRLRPPRHDLALRRAERQIGLRHRGVSPAAPRRGVSQVPRHDRGGRPADVRRASDPRQRRDAQDAAHPSVAGPPSAVPRALHPDGGLLDQPRRALVRAAHRQAAPARGSSQHAGARSGHRPVH